MRIALLTLATFALASAPLAQDVNFRGKVEDVSGTTGQFVVDCTNTSLTSAAFNLNDFVGMEVQIGGTWNGSPTSPSVFVTSLSVVPEIFEIGGGAKIGEFSNLGFTGTPGQLAIGLISTGTAFIPFQGTNGVIFLNPNIVAVTQTGVIGATGILQLPFLIPNDPGIIGVDIFGQGALLSPGSIVVSNPDCKTISS